MRYGKQCTCSQWLGPHTFACAHGSSKSDGGASAASGDSHTTAQSLARGKSRQVREHSSAASALLALATEDPVATVRATAMGALSRLVSGGVLSESHDASIVAMLQRMYDVVDVAGGDTDHAVREAALTLAVRWLSSLSMLLFRSLSPISQLFL